MKLIDIDLEWPEEVEIKDLRKLIISNISPKGDIIRWSISEIFNLNTPKKKRILKINVLVSTSQIKFY